MPKTKGIDRTVGKWINRARVAGADYEAGVKDPKRSWANAATAAADTYHTAVSSADTKSLFIRGIKRAGDARWQEMATKKGVDRFSTGVELSQGYYREQMGDILGQIESITLSARGPRGSAQNYKRGRDIGDKLHAWRLAKRSASTA